MRREARAPDGAPRRGTSSNPANRFERLHVERSGAADPGPAAPPTRYLRDTSRRVIARNDSPDVGFDASLNPYRGCEHGCVYCYARPTHEYLGFSAGLDFESRIVVKESAAELLREELAAPRWEPRTLLLSGVTDPYQPVERELELTRRCLQVLAECRHPVAVITKSTLVERDADLLAALAERDAACATISITTLREDLHRAMEPRAAAPTARLGAIRTLAAAGVPVNVNVAPVIPGLTEHELPVILEAGAEAGAVAAAFIPVRLPLAVAPLFEAWLERHFPERKAKVLNRIRSMRGGRLNDPRFGHRMRGEGPFAEHIRQSFHVHRRRLGLGAGPPPLSADGFRRPVLSGGQRDLFDSAP